MERKTQKLGFTLVEFMVCIVIIGILIALLLPARECAREAARRTQCMSQMKQVELAMHSYHDEYGQFPPAYTVDENGKPLHSWRTLLLPYLEEEVLYQKIKLDEPWDSPANLAVYENVPLDIYQCLSAPDGEEAVTRTNYVMVTSPKCVSDGPNSRSLDELPEKGAKTIHVVETTVPIRWYEPRDLKAEEIDFTVNDEAVPGISSGHPGVVLAVFCDGHVESISGDIKPEELRAMFEVDEKASWKKVFGELHTKASE